MESILTTEKGICYLCQRHTNTELHHIYFGHGKRKISDRLGLTVYLCHECHQGTYGVHGSHGHEVDMDLKQIAQFHWEQKYIKEYPYINHADMAAREEWIRKIGKNYL